MTQRKTERQLNLLICLLNSRRFLSREQIRDLVEGYSGLTDAAFQRSFERDKDDLRALGVPIETGSNEAWFDDEQGYRIPRGDFELPAVEFTADEQIVLGLASGVFAGAALGSQATTALSKLRAAGLEAETDRVQAIVPTVATSEPAFPVLWSAAISRTRVSFDYRAAGQTRTVEPWGLLNRRGAWYVTGLDVDRGELRLFKLARIIGEPTLVGAPGAFEPPPDAARNAAATFDSESGDQEALLAIRAEAAGSLRRRGEPAPDIDVPAGYQGYRVRFSRANDLAGEAAAAGDNVLVLEPPEVRALVLQRLQAAAGGR